MPVLPTLSTKNYGRRGKDEDAQTRLLSDDEHLARSKQQMAPSPAPPFLESSESDSESGQHRPAQSEPHHSPAGYRTPPGEKQQHDPLPLPSQETFSVPYERVPDADAAHRAALKRRSQHQQPQQQILPEARLQTQQRADQAAQSSQTSGTQRPASRAQPVVPPLPRLASDSSATTKIDESRRIPMVKRRPSPSLAVPTMPATATTTDAGEAAGAESRGAHEKEAPHQPFNLWGAVDGAAAALARLRIGVPHAPIVVTPTTAPIGFTFEAVDGHHSGDAAFHNPPDAAAVAESEAARRTEMAAANAATAEANPRSRVLDALVAGISRFGVLGIHHPVWFW